MIRYAWREFGDVSGAPMADGPTSWQAVAVCGLALRAVLASCLLGLPMRGVAAWAVKVW